jgi:hypothetical protein
VTYDGQVILSPPAEGFYHHYYYALGNLVCFHKIDTNIHLVAFAWKPGQVIDVNDAVKIKTGTGREFPFAIGHFNDEILVSTNQGWSYCYNGKQWRIAQSWDKSGSYQLYSTIHWQDKLLLAHYPSGYLWDYDGAGGKKIANWPPGLEGVSHQSREAQTTMIYGGDLYVGVWPWAEVWRYDADEDQWHFITRLISHPESSDQFIHPYDAEVDEHNATHEMQYQCNAWGQRCSGMSAVGESLMISKSAKWTWPADMQPEFMTNEQRLEHAQITKLTVPGNLTVPLKWTGKAIHLSLFITSDSMTIEQDGQLIAELPITADMADRVRDAEVKLGQGIFGPFAGESVDILK